MKPSIVIALVLALAAPVCAETYSWLDENGTFHFTEDPSRIPKKYRNRVNVRGDMSAAPEQTPVMEAGAEKKGSAGAPRPGVSGGNGTASAIGGQVALYGGKTEKAWRDEFALQEGELKSLETKLEQLRAQTQIPGGLGRERLAEVVKEYNETRESYKRKYAEYSGLMESARKAGLTVEIKK